MAEEIETDIRELHQKETWGVKNTDTRRVEPETTHRDERRHDDCNRDITADIP